MAFWLVLTRVMIDEHELSNTPSLLFILSNLDEQGFSIRSTLYSTLSSLSNIAVRAVVNPRYLALVSILAFYDLFTMGLSNRRQIRPRTRMRTQSSHSLYPPPRWFSLPLISIGFSWETLSLPPLGQPEMVFSYSGD